MTKLRPITELAYLFLILTVVANSSPPADNIKCSSNYNTKCTIANSYATFPDRTTCCVANVAYPHHTRRINLNRCRSQQNETKDEIMRVATRYSHSIPKLVCPDGPNRLIISTKYLNRTLEIDTICKTITVEGGATLEQVMKEAGKSRLALPHAPYWWGLTIGGLLSTGAHGSGLWGGGSVVHDYVVGLTVVSPGGPEEGYAHVRRLSRRNSNDLNATKVSLGVLGVISKVTLKLQPLFKRSITYLVENDTDLSEKNNNLWQSARVWGHYLVP